MIGDAGLTRTLPDWIEAFCDYTSELPSPLLLRKWAAISAVAGALERRVWVTSSGGRMYPNLYVLLIAPPAVGKSQAIAPVKDFWLRTKALKVAPDDISKASLIDTLEGSYQCKIIDKTNMVEYASLQVAAGEFGVLVPSHDLSFLNTLNYLFDNPDTFEEKKRTTKKETKITEPQINILAGTQPAYLAELLPETAWGMGFTSRLICVYAQSGVRPDLFALRTQDVHARSKLTEDLKTMTELYGELQWTPEAKAELVAWYTGGLQPAPTHSKLEHYNGRRILHMLKLCAISACSRDSQMVIQLADVDRAREWLLEIERFMPDIFKAMVGRSDIDVLEELHAVVWAAYSQNKQKPVHRQRVWAFLQTRVPAERVQRIIDTAIGSGMLKLGDPTDPNSSSFIPGPKPNRLIE